MDFLSPSLPFIRAFQLYGWLAWPMKILSVFGSESFFLLLLPLVYWNINRRLGARLGVLLIVSATLNDLIKVVFGLPRPFWSPGVRQLAPRPETSFGFPSGHAQSTAALWTYLALQTRARLWVAAAFGFLVLVALSRLYLGAHYPLDVVGGALIGYGVLWVFLRLERPVFAWWNAHSAAARGGAILAACAVLGALYWLAIGRLAPPPPGSPGYAAWAEAVAGAVFASRLGALCGLLSGLSLARRHAPFENEASLVLKSLRFALGLAVLAALRLVAGKVPATLFGSFAAYFLLTCWVTFGAPWLFLRLGWMRRAAVAAIAS